MDKKRNKILLVFLIVILFSGSEFLVKGDDPVSLAELDELMKEKTVKNCEKAVKGYEILLKKEPNNYELLYKIAKAYIAIVDIKTGALIEEKDEYKPILAKSGKLANDYAHKAYEINPDDKEVVASCLVAYGYYSSSFGIVKAIFKGAAGHYKDLCNQLIKLDDKHLGALGYRALGKFYHMAPWPVGSSGKALKYFKKAVATDNSVLGSHYYMGLIYFDKDKYDLAKKEFTFVVEKPPCDHEKHYIAPYKKEAKKYLQKIAKIKKKK